MAADSRTPLPNGMLKRIRRRIASERASVYLEYALVTTVTLGIAAVEKLSKDVGIPANLKGILKKEDIPFLAKSAYADACRPGNPRDCTIKDIEKLYKSLV